MDWIGLISGPLVGFAGGLVNQYFAFRNRKLEVEDNREKRAFDREQRALDRAHDIELTKAEQAGRERQAAIDGEIDLAGRDLDNLAAAMRADRATYLDTGAQTRSRGISWLMAIVDATRGLIRPVLTAGLVWQLWSLSRQVNLLVRAVNGGMMPPDVAGEIAIAVNLGIVQLAAVAVGYWFGSRPSVYKSLAG